MFFSTKAKAIIGMILVLLALVAPVRLLAGPLDVGPGKVQRMAAWEVASLSWKPWTTLGYGLISQLSVGPGEVGRMSYWDNATLKWKEWNGTIPPAGITGTAWKVLYSNAAGVYQELALGTAGTYIRSAGVAAAPTFSAPLLSDITGANWSMYATNGTGVFTAVPLPAAYHYLQGNGVAAAPTFVNALRPAMITTTIGPDTLDGPVVSKDSIKQATTQPIMLGQVSVKDSLNRFRTLSAMLDSMFALKAITCGDFSVDATTGRDSGIVAVRREYASSNALKFQKLQSGDADTAYTIRDKSGTLTQWGDTLGNLFLIQGRNLYCGTGAFLSNGGWYSSLGENFRINQEYGNISIGGGTFAFNQWKSIEGGKFSFGYKFNDTLKGCIGDSLSLRIKASNTQMTTITPWAISADSIFGYTNNCKMTSSQGLAIATVDTYKWWSGDSTFVGIAYINVGVLGTVAGADSVKIINKTKSDSALIAVPFGVKYLAWTINKVFPKDTLCIEYKKGGTTAGFGDVRVDLNTGTRKGKIW